MRVSGPRFGRRRPLGLSFAAALFFLLAWCEISTFGVLSIAVDEAGKNDWHREQVGLVHGAQFLPAYADPATNATMRSVAVLTEQAVVAVLNQRTGAIVWRKQLDGAAEVSAVAQSQLVTVSEAGKRVQSWDFRTGAMVWEARAEGTVGDLVTSEDGKLVGAVTDNELVVYDRAGEVQEAVAIAGKAKKGKTVSVEAAGTTFSVGRGSRADLASEFGFANGAATSATYRLDGSDYAAVVGYVDAKLVAMVVDLGTRAIVESQEYALDASERGTPREVFLTGYAKKGGSSAGFRLLLVSSDESLCLMQQGEVVWLREEALASITKTVVVDFPVSSEKVEAGGGLSGQATAQDRLGALVLGLKASLNFATREEVELLAKKKVEPAHFDPNGFNRQVLALTSSGKLFALHTSDGRVVWSKGLAGELRGDHVAMWVYSQDAAHGSPKIAIVSSGGSKANFVIVDGWTGAVLAAREVGTASSHLVRLQPSGPSALQGALLVDFEASQALALAERPEDLSHFDLGSTFVYSVDDQGGAVSGYRASVPASGLSIGSPLPLTNLWTTNLAPGQTIVASAAPNFFQKVYSRTRVLGDRSALYKYTNPNTLFVAAEGKDSESGEKKLFSYLVDTVTGRMLYSIAHRDASGPCHVVFKENWVVYKYRSERGNRDEVSVLELYEDEPTKNQNSISAHLYDLVTKANQSSEVSSYSPTAIRVLGQSYVLSLPVKAMTVTSSALGITANQVLVATLSDQIYAIDKKLLDPRRPTQKPTNADKEEGLIPYNEFLPIAPQKFVTYTHQVAGLREINCWPTRRESSVVVLAHGTDVFYARMMPSKSFDMLEDDFSYSLLVTTIFGLLVATFVVYSMVQKDNLKRNWV